MTKRYREAQDRNGSSARRQIEYEVVVHQVLKNKERLIARLNRNIIRDGDCRLYQGNTDRNGYPRITFRYKGKHLCIHACRVFLIMMIAGPIPKGYEAAHTNGCKNRRCVFHLEAQHYTINARTNGDYADIPF